MTGYQKRPDMEAGYPVSVRVDIRPNVQRGLFLTKKTLMQFYLWEAKYKKFQMYFSPKIVCNW